MLDVATLEVDEHDVVRISEAAKSNKIVTVMDSLSIEPTYCIFLPFIFVFMLVFVSFIPQMYYFLILTPSAKTLINNFAGYLIFVFT